MTPLSTGAQTNYGNTKNNVTTNPNLSMLLKNRTTCGELHLNRSNLAELSEVKESDILNDEEHDNSNSHRIKQNMNLVKNNIMRSSNTSISFTNHINKHHQQHNDNNGLKTPKTGTSLKIHTPSSNSLVQPKLSAAHSNNTSLDDLLLSNKQMLKMNHIEDALASVLDDMKQLDFSTSLATTPSQHFSQTNPILSTIKNNNNSTSNNLLKSMPVASSSTSMSTNGINTSAYSYYSPIGIGNSPNIKTDSIHKPVLKNSKNLSQRVVNFTENDNDDEDLSSSENSCEELNLKLGKNLSPPPSKTTMEKSIDSLINVLDSANSINNSSNSEIINNLPIQKFSFKSRNNNLINVASSPIKSLNTLTSNHVNNNEQFLNKRPDLVLDLPINLLVSSSPNNSNNHQQQQQQHQSTNSVR